MDAIERVNWLAHRWPIKLETFHYGSWLMHAGKIEGQRIGQVASREEYDEWLGRQRPSCLARLISEWPSVHPPVVVVTAGSYRLGRIPAELWCGYDATHLIDLPVLTLLSAKARALFPAWPNALIRVVQQGDLRSLNLQSATDARGGRLRAVA